jgi:DNA replication protein DnaC
MARVDGIDYYGRWEKAKIPVRLRDLGLDDYEPSHDTGEEALAKAYEFVENFKDHFVSQQRRMKGDYPQDRSNIGRGLLLWGRNGTRKTTLAASIATEVQWLSIHYQVFMIRFADYKNALTTTYGKEDSTEKEEAKKTLRMAEKATLLVLDDIGQEHRTSSGFTESTLHELIRRRVEDARPTIVTTNVEPDDMYSVYGPSFDSFRKEAFEAVMMIGPDSRKNYED